LLKLVLFGKPKTKNQKFWHFLVKIRGCIFKIYPYIEGMKENLDLKTYTEEQLAVLPKVRVTYIYDRDEKRWIAIMHLDEKLKIEFYLKEIEITLLMQHHKISNFGSRQTFDKEYLLFKGIAAKGTKAERVWYRIDLLVVPKYVVKKFLSVGERLYVQNDKRLNDLFQSLA